MRKGRGSRSASSQRWLDRQQRDPLVREARRRGYRSRAALKLLEIDRRHRLFGPGMHVLDVGAAPGGFSQVAAERVAPGGSVVACDLLEIAPMRGVELVQGDFTAPEVAEQLREHAPARGYDLVISDAAPNVSGIRERDEAEFLRLADQMLGLAERCLARHGRILIKLYQGEETRRWIAELRGRAGSALVIKPAGSRAESREIYVLGAALPQSRVAG